MMNLAKLLTIAALTALLAGCNTMDRIASIGEAPALSAIEDPTAQPGYRPVNMPMPEVVQASYQPNSLFSNEARGFFRDQRAHRVGDIVTVYVTISDSAQMSNQTARGRSSSNDAGMGGLLGSLFSQAVPAVDPSSVVALESGLSDSGNGSVNRAENVRTSVAAVVTQVLPNGNLVIEGRQEVRINFEVRDLLVAGIVRPEDIGADNTIESTKIAEARIAYGGRGQITDMQQPRYGSQLMDAILPF